MRTFNQKSKTVGYLSEWRSNEGTAHLVYEALVELECIHCGDAIYPGEKFTRTGYAGGGSRSAPTCKVCAVKSKVMRRKDERERL